MYIFLISSEVDHSIDTMEVCEPVTNIMPSPENKNVQNSSCERSYKCELCDISYTKVGFLVRHKKVKHDTTKTIFKCHLCQKHFDYKSSLKTHLLKSHKHLPKHYDAVVNQFSSESIPLNTNNRVLCNIINGNPRQRKVKHACDKCDCSYKDPGCLARHKRVKHTQTELHKCEICLKTFSWKNVLTRHMKEHYDESSSRLISKNITFVIDIESTENTVPILPTVWEFNCDTCDTLWPNNLALETHKLSHLPKIIQCKQCDKTFASYSSMYVHRNAVHLGISFSCHMCDQKFRFVEKL